MNQIYKKLRFLGLLFSVVAILFSCSNLMKNYEKRKMAQDMTDNRRGLYGQSYGQIDDPERDIEY